MSAEGNLAAFAATDAPRFEMWASIIRDRKFQQVAEVGVWRGQFAEAILSACPDLEQYYLIDPWRNLDDWNKPANVRDEKFDKIYDEAMRRTEHSASKRVVLRGRTTEVIDQIPDGSLDFAYVDGDHSLRGITIDLQLVWPKVRLGGILGGDDLMPHMWHHGAAFEPTGVFPYAVYFAEAMRSPIEALPGYQFAIQKTAAGFSFVDHTKQYKDVTLRTALQGEVPAGTPVEASVDSAKSSSRVRGLLSRK